MVWAACSVVVVFAAFYVLVPLFKGSQDDWDLELTAETDMDRLLDRKAVVYKNLRDLEQDYRMGRLSEADFQSLAADYKKESAVILQSLDRLSASDDLDEAIEKLLSARKASGRSSGSAQARNVGRCPSCGSEIIPGKKFCADCGRRLG